MTKNSHHYNSSHYVKPKQACAILGVCDETLRRWADSGKIKTLRSPYNYRLYDVESYLNPTKSQDDGSERKNYIYCRVSSEKQKKAGDLDRQTKSLKFKYPNHEIITDIGSGINFKRQGLRRILQMVFQGNVEQIVVAHRDRLCTFAFELIEWICDQHGTKITVEDKMDETPETELAQDLLSIITIFSCRNKGMRRHRKKDDEDKNTSNSEPEENPENMD